MARAIEEDKIAEMLSEQSTDEREYDISLSLTEREAEVLFNALASKERFLKAYGEPLIAGGMNDARMALAEQMQDALNQESKELIGQQSEKPDSTIDAPTLRELSSKW